MEELRRFYRKTLGVVAVALVGLAVALHQAKSTLPGWVPEWARDAARFALDTKILVVAVLGVTEVLTRKWLWRYRHRRLNFHGVWRGITTYETRWCGDGQKPERVSDMKVEHLASIDQDCLRIKVAPTQASKFATFKSIAADVVDESLCYAYAVDYREGAEDANFPNHVVGYEQLAVVSVDERGAPSELSGWFAHCLQHHGPLYTGTVTFTRLSKKDARQAGKRTR